MNYKLENKFACKTGAKQNAKYTMLEIIEDAYSIFRQGPTEHAVCDCCMNKHIRIDFFSHSQRNLPLEYLQEWFSAAAENPMPKAAWRFVLPRVLEALASGDEPSNIGFEVCLSRYPTGIKENWNQEEWQVLDQFQREFLKVISVNVKEYLDDYICMFANAGWPTEDLYQQVRDFNDETLTRRLWNDWCSWGINHAIWITPFWKHPSVARAFYLSDELLDRISNYALDEKTPTEMQNKAYDVANVIHLKSEL